MVGDQRLGRSKAIRDDAVQSYAAADDQVAGAIRCTRWCAQRIVDRIGAGIIRMAVDFRQKRRTLHQGCRQLIQDRAQRKIEVGASGSKAGIGCDFYIKPVIDGLGDLGGSTSCGAFHCPFLVFLMLAPNRAYCGAGPGGANRRVLGTVLCYVSDVLMQPAVAIVTATIRAPILNLFMLFSFNSYYETASEKTPYPMLWIVVVTHYLLFPCYFYC